MEPSLAQRLADALVAVTPDHPEAVERLRDLYDPAVVFQDPIQKIHGLDEFLSMNRRLLRRMRTLTWTITSLQGDDEALFLEWVMRGTARLGPTMHVGGVTRARVRGSLIFDHRDYWDMGELVASTLPGGPRFLQALRAPFA